MNEYVNFYEKNKISPVRQNIDDFALHVKRREGLYRQLGLLRANFEGKKVLEVGPGGGYNALVTYSFKPSKYVLVEPNSTGFQELKNNFATHGFNENVEFHNTFLEDFTCKESFDVVMCEGLIQGLPNREVFLTKLSSLVKEGGVLVITVADEISMFFEILRRYLANELIKDEKDFKKQIAILVEAFSPHLETLKGMTRRYDDWCADLLCDAIYNHTFSVADAITLFQNEYFFYGASPNVFHDFRWYKALPHNPLEYNAYYLEQFNTQRHNFINSAQTYDKCSAEKNVALSLTCKELIEVVKSLEKHDGTYAKEDAIALLKRIADNLLEVDSSLHVSIHEVIEIVQKENLTTHDVSQLCTMKPLFGRGQTFLSFCKETL
ncbi:MAG: class I SAM-dependent methyltransferase [Campylobacterales bacterium]|nr:class I SAM-dependent methyltransferase [Campylobacterales bacterium]